ncbi:Alpha/Beta hydrolase protein [Umbelopsis sp. AD052]|nr:Alpha/Beta hydrolase protein [Umbelopsis sp. AD052]
MRFWTRVNSHLATRSIGSENLLEVYADIWRNLSGRGHGAPQKLGSKKQQSLAVAEKAMFRCVQQPLESRMTEIRPTWNRKSPKPCYISSVSTNSDTTEKKPDLVLIHGYGGGKGIWIRNIDELSKHYTVHAIDLLGWGRSTRDRYCGNDAVKAQSYFVDSLESWRQEMGIEKMTLLGHSFGGFVSASYALKHRERLDRLVLLSPIGLKGFKFPSDQIFSLSSRILFTSIWTLTPQRILGMLPKSRVLQLLARSRVRTVQAFGYPDDTVIRYIYELATQSVSGEMAFSKLMGHTKDSSMAWHVPLKDQLHQLHDLPLYMVYGEHDWIDFRYANEVKKNILPQTKVFLLPNAGHHGYVEAADLLSHIVSNLDKDLSSLEYHGELDSARGNYLSFA